LTAGQQHQRPVGELLNHAPSSLDYPSGGQMGTTPPRTKEKPLIRMPDQGFLYQFEGIETLSLRRNALL
jgi:hypothetical protein